jgi:hypothetical protein
MRSDRQRGTRQAIVDREREPDQTKPNDLITGNSSDIKVYHLDCIGDLWHHPRNPKRVGEAHSPLHQSCHP